MSLGLVLVGLVAALGLSACKPPPLVITARATPATGVVVAHVVTVSGTVTPKRSGGTVVVERSVGGVWKRQASATLSASSTYQVPMHPSEVGTYTIRARRVATGSDPAIVSPTISFPVTALPTLDFGRGQYAGATYCAGGPCYWIIANFANLPTGTYTLKCWLDGTEFTLPNSTPIRWTGTIAGTGSQRSNCAASPGIGPLRIELVGNGIDVYSPSKNMP
jgi:hypothetical protein